MLVFLTQLLGKLTTYSLYKSSAKIFSDYISLFISWLQKQWHIIALSGMPFVLLLSVRTLEKQNVITQTERKMNYLILTDTDFFRQINNNDNRNLRAVYNGFVKQVIELCYGSTNPQESFLAMTCAEIELQILYEHRLWHDEGEKKEYVHKAMLLVHHILELLKEHTPSQMHIPPFRSGKGLSLIHI